jgi:3-hydroxypropanoate dehydrogenase
MGGTIPVRIARFRTASAMRGTTYQENCMIDDQALDTLFRKARTHNVWLDKPVTDAQLKQLYDVMKFGPTSTNALPARILFLRSKEAKERLKPFLSPGNVDKTMAAPVTAVIGYDTRFYEHLPRLFPHNQQAINLYAPEEKKAFADITAFRNGSLQGAYLIIAARAIGLDVGAMSGFNIDGVDKEFWAGTTVKTNFLANLGYGDESKLFARSPRFEFDEICKII